MLLGQEVVAPKMRYAFKRLGLNASQTRGCPRGRCDRALKRRPLNPNQLERLHRRKCDMPLKRRAVDAGHPSIPCAHQGAIEGACQKDALSTLGATPVHELLVTPAIAAVLEGGKGEVHDRHGGNRGDDHEHGGQDVESGHDGHHPFRYKSSARHTMRTIFRSLRATGGARIAYREPHALRCEPKTERRTRGTSATRPGPRTARGTHLSCAAARAYAGGTRAATRTPRRNKHTLSRILRVQHSRLCRTIHRATQTTERWRADVRARTRISPMQAGTMVRHVSFSSEGAP